ncbi:13132_t:CDS:1, partial [Ambispora leptoticha]
HHWNIDSANYCGLARPFELYLKATASGDTNDSIKNSIVYN